MGCVARTTTAPAAPDSTRSEARVVSLKLDGRRGTSVLMKLAPLILLFVACGRGPVVGEMPGIASGRQRPELTRADWVFKTLTAAHCNDSSRTLRFSSDGGFSVSHERNVLDAAFQCTKPVTVEHGRWSAEADAVLVETATASWRAQVAISPAPRLHVASGSITPSPPALTTRAFLRRGDVWVEEHERSSAGHDVWTKTTVAVTGSEPVCALTVTVEVDVDGIRATETFTPPCTRVSDPRSGWRAFGNLEKLHHRFDAVMAAGVFERHSAPLAKAISDGLVLALVVDDATPTLAVHPASSDEALGWYDAVP